MDLNKTAKALRDNGYLVSLFHTAEEACLYLNRQIDNTTVGMGGSKTLEEMEYMIASRLTIRYSGTGVLTGAAMPR